jgi:hypothetical protein
MALVLKYARFSSRECANVCGCGTGGAGVGVLAKEQKGFHLARSSLSDRKRYFCGIDTTAQALSMLEQAGLLDRMPVEMREDLIAFFQSRQDPQDGFFKDPDPKGREDPRLLGRALNYATGALEKLGAAPEHPLPETRAVLDRYPELRSQRAFEKYLESLDWSMPYRSGDWSAVRAKMADSLEEPLRTRLVETYFEFLKSLQSPVTGFWGKDGTRRDYQYVSGAMKISSAFGFYKRPIPMPDQILESIVWVLKHDHNVESNYCYVRNPLTALDAVMPYLSTPPTRRQIYEIIAGTTKHHRMFLQADGGFSRSSRRAFRGEYPLVVGKGLAEGDTNAGTQAMHTVRRVCYKLAGKNMPELSGATNFYSQVDYR